MFKLENFFCDSKRFPSMSRLTLIGSFMVSSGIMLRLTLDGKMTENYMLVYLGTFATTYGAAKLKEGFGRVGKKP